MHTKCIYKSLFLSLNVGKGEGQAMPPGRM